MENSPLPSEYARKRTREQVAELVARAEPSIARLFKAEDGDIEFAEALHQVPVIARTDAAIASWSHPDAFLLTVFLNSQALVAALDAKITAEQDDAKAMTPEQKQKALADINLEMLALDRELAELVWLAQSRNLPHEFRPDANPLAVLALELVTLPRGEALSGSSPGMSYEIRR